MFNLSDLTITSLDTITAFDLADKLCFILDELQDATISNTQETTDITGKQGRKLSTLKRNKGVTISATNGLVSAGLLEAQVGGKFKKEAKQLVMKTEYLVVKTNAATMSMKAAGTAGAEIKSLYKHNSDGAAGKEFEQVASELATGKFTYTPDTNALAFFAGDLQDGDEIVVTYEAEVEAAVLENKSDAYSAKLKLYIDATAEDRCGNVYHAQFYIPKADVSGEFELALGNDQTVHAFEAESLAGACGTGGQLWTYTVFGVNQAA